MIASWTQPKTTITKTGTATTTAPKISSWADNPPVNKFGMDVSTHIYNPLNPKNQLEAPQPAPQLNTAEKLSTGLVNRFPGTTQTINEINQDPLNLKKDAYQNMLPAMWNAIKDPIGEEALNIQRLITGRDDVSGKRLSNAEVIGTGLKAEAGVANVLLSPITALFNGANTVPILGTVSRLITVPFQAVGEAGAGVANGIVNKLPISQKSKDQINPGIQQIFALAGQLALGKAGLDTKAWDALKSKFGEADATTIVHKAQELAATKEPQTSESAGFTTKPVPEAPTAPKTAPTEAIKPNIKTSLGVTIHEFDGYKVSDTGKNAWRVATPDGKSGSIPKTFASTPEDAYKAFKLDAQLTNPLISEAKKYKSAEEFVGGQLKSNSWSEAQKTNPDLWNTGILRKSQEPYGAKGVIPMDVHSAQAKWQNYGQYSEIEAGKVFDKVDNYGYYLDKEGNTIRDVNGNALQNNTKFGGEDAMVSNEQLKQNLVNSFSTPEGKKYLSEVINALPKNSDGSITAYRIGGISKEGLQSYTLSEGMAKTFSNQGTDILPPGTPGLPKGGYKNFGVLPTNTVKIDPKGIKAWSPYDAEILVEPKFVQSKSQLTDIYNKAKETPAETGKITKASSDINETLVKKGFDSIPESEQAKYTPTTKADQIAKITDFMTKNLEEAKAAATGDLPIPHDILPQPLFNAIEEYATKNNDVQLLRDLAKSPLATQLSEAGQALGSHGFNDNPNSAVAAIRDVAKVREKKTAGKVKDTVAGIKKEISKTHTKETWSSFIDSLKC